MIAVRARFALVVSDLKPVPRAGDGGGAGFKSDTTRHLWGERSHVGHGTWPWLLASPMPNTGHGALDCARLAHHGAGECVPLNGTHVILTITDRNLANWRPVSVRKLEHQQDRIDLGIDLGP